jgi:uncharacterized protein with von Willebrand factor type A (vWA) domain
MPKYYGERAFTYSRFDGTKEPPGIDGSEVFFALSDDLLYHGDLEAALRRLMHQGMTLRSGEQLSGLRELLEQLRRRRDELQGRLNPDGLVERVASKLAEILARERRSLDDAVSAAIASGEELKLRQATDAAHARHVELDALPEDPAGQIVSLASYDFNSPEARQGFAQLLSDLRRDLVQLQLDGAAGALAGASRDGREHLRDGLDALNRILEQHGAGEEIDPSFASFMENYGDLFPGDPATLDELLAQLAARMAAASRLVASMSTEQRAQLEALGAELFGNVDLAWQLDRLSANLRNALPEMNWDEPMAVGQSDLSIPITLGQAGALIGEIAELNRLEQLLRFATEPSVLAEVDFDTVEGALGPDARRSLEALGELTRALQEQGFVDRRGGRLELTPKGMRRLGQNALGELFAHLRRDHIGDHRDFVFGVGQDLDLETKAYEFGDPFHVDIEETLRNGMLRMAALDEKGTDAFHEHQESRGIALPILLDKGDFAIRQTAQVVAASTVLAIDLSLSMPMRENFLAAKKVAVALQALIASRYPRDYLGLVGFSARAREIRANELPELAWDFAYGTNLQHSLALSRKMLANKPGSKQIIVITDGEPTAHLQGNGEVFFHHPTVPETLAATFVEVIRCTKERIIINVFVLDATKSLRHFVEEIAKRNRGRAFFTTPGTLGDYVLVDFVGHRSRSRRRLRPGA